MYAVRALFVVLLLLGLGRSAAAEDDPTRVPFEAARVAVAKLGDHLNRTRTQALRDLPRHARYDDRARRYVRFTEPEINAWFRAPAADIQARFDALDVARREWLAGRIALDVYFERTYRAVTDAVSRFWATEIDVTRAGYVVALRSEIGLENERQRVEAERARRDIDARYRPGTPAHEQASRAFAARQRDRRRQVFEAVATRYRHTKDQVAAIRAEWAAETWRWSDFARRRSTHRDDVHQRWMAEFRNVVYRNFSSGVGDRTSVIDFFVSYPGSPDRIITGWNPKEWSPGRQYPDVQLWEDGHGVLKMDMLARVPVDQYRTPDTTPLPPLEPASVGIGAMDPGHPLTEAVPNQFFRVVAQARGTATTDRNRQFSAVVKNATTGAEARVALLPVGRGGGLFASDPIFISTPGADPEPRFAGIPGCPGEQLQATAGQHSAGLVIVPSSGMFAPLPCVRPPAPPRFTLAPLGPTALQFDPEDVRRYAGHLVSFSGLLPSDPRGTQMIDPPRVVLKDERGRPLADEAIVWLFPDRQEAITTYTDARGVARLDFRVGARGTFVAFVDGVPSSDPLGDGPRKIIAMPSDPVFATLLDGGPVTFTIDFVRPTTLDVIDRTGMQPGALVSGDNFFVRVYLGRRDAARVGNAPAIQVRLDPPIRLRQPYHVEAERQIPGIYESKTRTNIRTRASIVGALSPGMLVDAGDVITVSFGQAQAGIKVYDSALVLAETRIRQVVAFWRDAATTAQRAPGNQRELPRLRLLVQLAQNAERWLDDSQLAYGYRVAAAAAYLPLFEKDVRSLQPYTQPGALEMYGSRRHATHCEAEHEAVAGALRSSYNEDPTRLGNRVVRIGSGLVNFVVSLPDMMFVQPFLGGYTAITGWTAEGEIATTFERVMGGFDALVALAAAPEAIVGVAARAASAINAAGRLSARVLIAEGLVAGSVTLAKGLASPVGHAIARAAPEIVVQAAMEIATEELLLDDARRERGPWLASLEVAGSHLTPRPRRTPRPRVERLEARLKGRQSYIVKRSEDLHEARSHLATLRQSGASPAQIEAGERRIAHVQRRLDYHRAIWQRASDALNELALRPHLTLDDIRAMTPPRRPAARDLYKGTPAHTHYEWQVQNDLAAQGFTDWERASGVAVPSGYPSPLSQGFLNRPASFDEFVIRKRVQTPVPDHINPRTLDVGDSKYYDWDELKSPDPRVQTERYKAAAAEINDTIEKARLVQIQKVREDILSRLPRDQQLTEDVLKARIREEMRTKKVFIFTPEDVPGDIRQYIGRLRGPLEQGLIEFRTIAPRPLSW